ncbi:MAG TPA: trypsin-like peptidase domain-containing protein [Vicinamibacterales bacterium]|nr:trypsin-like peptidase domain-containing protein [Vicinamibacterales bacterium]
MPSSTDAAVTAPVTDDVVTMARAALVQVESPDGRGTGFFSATDGVTTSSDLIGRQKSATVTLADGRRLDATVSSVADQPHLAQLHVNVTGAPVTTWLAPSPVREARAGESVAMLTWPDAAARGVVKALRRLQGAEIFETTLLVHTEDEGAPVVDHTGRVVAVVSGRRAVSFDSARPYFHARP